MLEYPKNTLVLGIQIKNLPKTTMAYFAFINLR